MRLVLGLICLHKPAIQEFTLPDFPVPLSGRLLSRLMAYRGMLRKEAPITVSLRI